MPAPSPAPSGTARLLLPLWDSVGPGFWPEDVVVEIWEEVVELKKKPSFSSCNPKHVDLTYMSVLLFTAIATALRHAAAVIPSTVKEVAAGPCQSDE